MLVKTVLIAHSLAGALAANAGPAATPGQAQAPVQVAQAPFQLASGNAVGVYETLPTSAARERVVETGLATWYRNQRAPNRTASGEHYNAMGMTAAHRFIPLGTMVRVLDQATGRSVVVRVNDREPPHGIRCIDLAEGAALALGIHQEGWARVKITEVGTQAGPDTEPTEVAEAPDDASAVRPVHKMVHHMRVVRRRH